MTLVEVLVAMAIAFAVLGTLTYGYIQAYRLTDVTTLQAAGQRLVVQRLDTVRQSSWRYVGTTNELNQLTNFAGTLMLPLELPLLTPQPFMARLVTQVDGLGTNPPLQRIRVTCIWTNTNGQAYTNQVATLRAPD
jgi:type II secretory pathway pseudopilin PulG